MSIFISFSTLFRIGFWVVVVSVVIGIALSDHGTPEGGAAPDMVVTPTGHVAAANGVHGR
jgi:hypothetical protein